MAITSAFLNARSGLSAAEKWSEITSGNIANANRAGYVRRELALTSGPAGGVEVNGIRREVDASLDRAHRLEIGRMAKQGAMADGLSTYTALLGQPGDAQALTNRVSALQTSFDTLSNAPGDPAVQRATLRAAEALTQTLNAASAGLERAGMTARDGIATDVALVNTTLRSVAELNKQLQLETNPTLRRASLEDEMSQKLDALSELIDFKVQRDSQYGLTITSSGGTPLVEGAEVHQLAFDRNAGRLTAGNIDITPGVAGVRGFSEGRLAGRITLLNETLPRMQLQLDSVARTLVDGFAAADASVAAGAPSLFTDAGAALAPGATTGLSGRIAVNAAMDPDRGGALWRLREGAGAAAEGPQGDSTQVEAFIGALSAEVSFPTAAGLGDTANLADFTAALMSDQNYAKNGAEDRLSALRAGAGAIEGARFGVQGVNIDDELQQLMAIEQAYTANATVMRTLSEMMDSLLAAVR